MEKTTLMDPAPFLCSEDACAALVAEIPGYCPAHQGQPPRYDFEPLPPSVGPATLVRRRAAGDRGCPHVSTAVRQ